MAQGKAAVVSLCGAATPLDVTGTVEIAFTRSGESAVRPIPHRCYRRPQTALGGGDQQLAVAPQRSSNPAHCNSAGQFRSRS